MKPFGRGKRVHFPSKKDSHPPKGYINWWEDMNTYIPRSTMKQLFNREIDN